MAGSSPSSERISRAHANSVELPLLGDKMSTHKQTKPVLLLIALCFLTVFAPRLLVFPISDINSDEYYSALIAQGLLRGQMPFDYVFNGHHPAASYYFYAPFLAVFGSNIIAIRSIALTYVSLSFYLIYRICTAAGLEPRLSSVCAAIYGIITLPFGGLASNTELILNPLVMWVTLLCLSYSRAPSRTGAVMIGAISGICVSVNYIAAPIVGTLGLCAIILVRRNPRAAVTDAAFAALSALGMFFILLLPVILFGDIIAYFSEQIAFLKLYSLGLQSPLRSDLLWQLKDWTLPILLPAVPAATILWFTRPKSPLSGREKMILIYLWCYVVAAVLAAVAPRRFYQHYALLVAPAITLMTGAVLYSRRGRNTLRYALVLTAAIAVAQPAFSSTTRWDFERGLDGWVHWLNHQPSDSLAEVAREVKLYTHSGDYIFVTHTHDLYILSDTRSPTRFAFGGDWWMSDPEIMRIFGTTPAEEFEKILALHPKMIVVGPPVRWGVRHIDPEYLRKLTAALASQYEYLKTIDRVELYRLKPF